MAARSPTCLRAQSAHAFGRSDRPDRGEHRQLGLREAPVIRLDHLTDAEARAYRIADNRLTELGIWDEELLAAEFARLKEDSFDLGVIGFDDSEIERLMDGLDAGPQAAEDDIVPEPPVKPTTRLGPKALGI